MARYAIAQLKPRILLPTTPSTISRGNYNILDHIVLMDDGSVIKVIEMNADEDAEQVFNLLSSPTFAKLPLANANQTLARMVK
ncbi:MAG: hypothetical protein WBN45_13990 [Arenicellales bacterium]|jgi:hypothetical protein